MPSDRTSSVASHLTSAIWGDTESSDTLHDANSSLNERSQTHATHETLGRHLASPWCAIYFCRLGIVRPIYTYSFGTAAGPVLPPPHPLLALAPLLRPPCARSVPPMRIRHCGHTRAPLDVCNDIIKLDSADTSALSDVDALERRRQNEDRKRCSPGATSSSPSRSPLPSLRRALRLSGLCGVVGCQGPQRGCS